jgi:hypothetical protein
VIGRTQKPFPENNQHSQETDIHASGGIQTHNSSKPTAAESNGYYDWIFPKRADINIVEITFSASVDYQISVIEPADVSLYLPCGLERKILNSNLASLIYFSY